MVNFGSAYNDHYLVVINGNEVVFSDPNRKPCLRKCLSIAKRKKDLVELWYQFGSGKTLLLDYWN